jgi:hypothetical protein
VVGDLTHGVTQPFPHLALPCQWSMFSVEAAYHHLWQLREARDLLMTQQRIKVSHQGASRSSIVDRQLS